MGLINLKGLQIPFMSITEPDMGKLYYRQVSLML